jgi:hypothetical protein
MNKSVLKARESSPIKHSSTATEGGEGVGKFVQPYQMPSIYDNIEESIIS